MARFKWTGKKFEYFRTDADWWGTIAPPDPSRFAEKWQVEDAVYLDLGATNRCVRGIFVKKIYACDDGGFATTASGVLPTADYHLTTKSYVDDALSIITSQYSGLGDVQSTGWTSGYLSQYDGSLWRPYELPYIVPSGNYQISGNYLTLTDADTRYQFSGFLTVSGSAGPSVNNVTLLEFINSTIIDVGGGRVQISGSGGVGGGASSLTELTDVDITGPLTSGDVLIYNGTNFIDGPWNVHFAPSGNYQLSGNYITESYGDTLYAPSGNYEISGTSDVRITAHEAVWNHDDFITSSGSWEISGSSEAAIDAHVALADPHEQYLTEAAASGNYELSGTSDAGIAAHEVTWDHSSFITSSGNWEISGSAETQRTAHETVWDHDTFITSSGNWEISGSAESHITVHEAAEDPHSQYLTQAEGDVIYAQSGATLDAFAGSGLIATGDFIHAQVGSGLYLQDDLFGVDLSNIALSGDYSTITQGYELYGISGYLVPSGNYVTLVQGHELWAASGNYAISGNYPTIEWGDTRWETSGTVDAHVALSDPHTQYITHLSGNQSYVPLTRTISTGTGLTGGSALSSDLSLGIDFTEVQASGNYPTLIYGDTRWALSGNYELSGSAAALTHDGFADFVLDEHIDHTSVSINAGSGLIGGGTIAADKDIHVQVGAGLALQDDSVGFDVVFGDGRYALSGVASVSGRYEESFYATDGHVVAHNLGVHPQVIVYNQVDNKAMEVGVTYTNYNELSLDYQGVISGIVLCDIGGGTTGVPGAHVHDAVDITTGSLNDGRISESNVTQHEAAIDHDALTNFAPNKHTDHTSVILTAGAGLTAGGTGDITTSRTFDVGAGTNIIVNANDIAVDMTAVQASGNYPTIEQGRQFWKASGIYSVPSGNYVTVGQGHELWKASGIYLVPSGDYATVDQGHILWKASGIYSVPSGDYATVDQGHQLWKASGVYSVPSGNYATYATGDMRWEASGTVDTHIALSDPHTQYLTHISGDQSYVPLARTISTGTGLTGGGVLTSNLNLGIDFTEVQASGNYPTIAFGNEQWTLSGIYTVSGTSYTKAESDVRFEVSGSAAALTHDGFADFVSNEHIDHTSVDITAGAGLTGGGDISSTRTIDVGAGTNITVNANDIAVDMTAVQESGNYPTIAYGDTRWALSGIYIVSGTSYTKAESDLRFEVSGSAAALTHDGFADFISDEHVDHTSVDITAGAGLTGGGDISSTKVINVGAGTGITVNANDVAADMTVIQASGNYPTITYGDTRWALSGTLSTSGTSYTKAESDLRFEVSGSTAALTHDGFADTVSNEHIDHTSVTLTAGAGLAAGGTGDITASRTFDIGAGTGITVNANDIEIDFTEVQASGNYPTVAYGDTRWALSGTIAPTVFEDNAFQLQDGAAPTATGQFNLDNVTPGANRILTWPDEDVDLTPWTVTAGAGLTGGGKLTGDITINIGELFSFGGLKVEADTIEVDLSNFQNMVRTIHALDTIPYYNASSLTSERLTFEQIEAAIDHDSLTGFVSNEHKNHAAIAINAGSGLVGGGSITDSRDLHIQIGSGLYLQDDLVGFDTVFGDARYTLSGLDVGPSTLSGLTDTAITTPTSGQILSYNGSAWVEANNGGLTRADLSTSGNSPLKPLHRVNFGNVELPSGFSLQCAGAEVYSAARGYGILKTNASNVRRSAAVDGANYHGEVLEDATFIWNQFAGLHYFRMDLPQPGKYLVKAALGDIYTQGPMYLAVSGYSTGETDIVLYSGTAQETAHEWVYPSGYVDTLNDGVDYIILEWGSEGGSGPITTFSWVEYWPNTTWGAIDRQISVRQTELDNSYLRIDGDNIPMTGQLTIENSAGANQIVFNSTTSNTIYWNTHGIAAPTDTSRSAGTKLVLWPALTASSTDFAVGIEGNSMWFSVPTLQDTRHFYWYGDETRIMDLDGTGNLTLPNGASTLTTAIVKVSGSASTGIEINRDSAISTLGPGIAFGRRDVGCGQIRGYDDGIYISNYNGNFPGFATFSSSGILTNDIWADNLTAAVVRASGTTSTGIYIDRLTNDPFVHFSKNSVGLGQVRGFDDGIAITNANGNYPGFAMLSASGILTNDVWGTTLSGTIIEATHISGGQLSYGGQDTDERYQASGIGGATTLVALTDTTITTPISGQILSYDGSAWVNAPNPASASGHYQESFYATSNHTVTHNLGVHPQVSVYSLADNKLIQVEVTYNDVNSLDLDFLGTISGVALCDTGSGGGGSGAGSGSATTTTIQTKTLLQEWTGGSASFTSIELVSGYDTIILEGSTRNSSTGAGDYDTPTLVFNGDDTATNYWKQYQWSTDGNAFASAEANNNNVFALQSNSNADATHASWQMVLKDYANDDREKHVSFHSTFHNDINGPNQVWGMVKWANDASISGINLVSASNTWSADSIIRVYGVRDESVVTSVSGTVGGGASAFTDLTDTEGTWTSGQTARFDGTNFVPYEANPNVGDTEPAASEDYEREFIVITSGGVQYQAVCLSGTAGYSWQTIAMGDQ